MMMKASFKGKFDVDKSGGTGSLTFNAGNVKLRATMTDATLVAGPSLNGLSLAVEKPGFFIIDYNVPKKVTPFFLFPIFEVNPFSFKPIRNDK